jgi:hypothetical protein
MLLRHQFRHSHNKKYAIGHRSNPLTISSHPHHPYFINTFVSTSGPTKWMSADNRHSHLLFARWPHWWPHSLSLRKIVTFGNRKHLYNTLKINNKELTWQYPADLVFWRSLTPRHYLLPNNTLSYSATLVRSFISDRPNHVSWPAHCRLLTNGTDQLTPSLLLSFPHPPFTTIHLFFIGTLINFERTPYFQSAFHSMFCSQQKFDYLFLRIYSLNLLIMTSIFALRKKWNLRNFHETKRT